MKPFNKPEDWEPGPLFNDGTGDFYEPESVLIHRNHKKNGLEYLVKWKGYSEDEATWEPSENLEQYALPLIDQYWQSKEGRDQ